MMAWSFLGEPTSLLEQDNPADLVEIFLGFAFIAWLFVFPGGLVVGVPALLISRRFGLNASRSQFLMFGGAAGLLGALFSAALWFGAGPGFGEALQSWLFYGGITGVLAALVWWLLVERHKSQVS